MEVGEVECWGWNVGGVGEVGFFFDDDVGVVEVVDCRVISG